MRGNANQLGRGREVFSQIQKLPKQGSMTTLKKDPRVAAL